MSTDIVAIGTLGRFESSTEVPTPGTNTLSSTSRESNVRDSFKKFILDNLVSVEHLNVTFDKRLTSPKVQGSEIDKWLSFNFGPLSGGSVSSLHIMVIPCTRKDAEGFKLAQLRDKVMGYLTDNSQPDNMRRIPFYRSSASEAWQLIGGLIVDVYPDESGVMENDEGIKHKIIEIVLRWGG